MNKSKAIVSAVFGSFTSVLCMVALGSKSWLTIKSLISFISVGPFGICIVGQAASICINSASTFVSFRVAAALLFLALFSSLTSTCFTLYCIVKREGRFMKVSIALYAASALFGFVAMISFIGMKEGVVGGLGGVTEAVALSYSWGFGVGWVVIPMWIISCVLTAAANK